MEKASQHRVTRTAAGMPPPRTCERRPEQTADTAAVVVQSLPLTLPQQLACVLWTGSRLLVVGRWRQDRAHFTGVFLNRRREVEGFPTEVVGIQGNYKSLDQHAAAVVGSCVFLFGGREGRRDGRTNCTAVLNISSMKLTLLTCSGSLPAPRCGHTLSPVGNRLYLFGGELSDQHLSNDIHVFETGLMQWREVGIKGECPDRRTGHAAAVLGTKVYIFGGRNEEGKLLNDLYVLHTGSNPRWERIEGKGVSPAGRAGHSLIAVGTRLFVYGGHFARHTGLPVLWHSDWHTFDLVTLNWKEVDFEASTMPQYEHWAVAHASIVSLVGNSVEGLGRISTIETWRVSFAEPSAPEKLANDMQALLDSGLASDVSFVVQGQEFRAHRCILAARMPATSLDSLLGSSHNTGAGTGQTNDQDVPDNRVFVNNTTMAAFTSLISLLYTDRSRMLSDDSSDFLDLIARYNLGERVSKIGFYPLSALEYEEGEQPLQEQTNGGSLVPDMRRLFEMSLVSGDESALVSNTDLRTQRLLSLRDLVFVVEDVKTNTVHRIATYKCVILARSEYFRALLSSTFGGAERKEVAINTSADSDNDSVDLETFVGVLEFIFTGTLDRFQTRLNQSRVMEQRTQPTQHPIQASLPIASPLPDSSTWYRSWWRGLWAEKRGEEEEKEEARTQPEATQNAEEKESEEVIQEDLISRVVRLLAASTRFALFDLRTACEGLLLAELERHQYEYDTANYPLNPQSTDGARVGSELNAFGRPRGGQADAMELVLPLLIVADTFGCERLRSACLCAATLHADLIRRRVKEYRSDMDAKLMTDLSFWLNAGLGHV